MNETALLQLILMALLSNLIKDAAADIVDALQKGKGGYNIQRFRFC